MIDLILFPSSYFSIKKVDEDLQGEYEAAKSTGLYDTILFGYDMYVNEGRLVLSKIPDTRRKAIMRGWMMKPEQYADFYHKLLDSNIQLVTTPEEYEQMHIFPNAYTLFGEDTAAMELYPLHKQINVENIKKKYNRFMIKDYVKSVKGTDFPKYFDASITQDEFDRWMEIFYKYRGNLLTGGICVKEYLNLKFYECGYGMSKEDKHRPNEYRVFYANHEIVSVSRNSAQPEFAPKPPNELLEKYKFLPSCYYTVDYAELEDGSWKVLEAGDGSVSGLSENQDAKHYFRSLYYALKN